MITVMPLESKLYTEGSSSGVPCLLVHCSKDGKETEVQKVLEEILASKMRLVLVVGSVEEYPELRELIAGCSVKGKTVIYKTPGSSSVQTIRMIRNVKIVLDAEVPNAKVNTFNTANLSYLKELDEVVFTVADIKDYEEAVAFIKTKIIRQPTIIFRVSSENKNPSAIIKKYLKDCEEFYFKSRLCKESV